MVPTRSERAGKERAKTAPQRMETENEFLFTREKYAKQNILGGGIPTPLKNVSSSVGMMTFPIYGKMPCSKPPTRYDFWATY